MPLLALGVLTPAVSVAAVAAPVAVAQSAAAPAPIPPECPWMDTSLSADARARLLLEASTLEQKMRWLVEQPAADPEQTEWRGGVVYPEQVPCTPDLGARARPQVTWSARPRSPA